MGYNNGLESRYQYTLPMYEITHICIGRNIGDEYVYIMIGV